MSAKTRLIHFKQEKYNTETSAGEIGSAGRGRNVMPGGVCRLLGPPLTNQCSASEQLQPEQFIQMEILCRVRNVTKIL